MFSVLAASSMLASCTFADVKPIKGAAVTSDAAEGSAETEGGTFQPAADGTFSQEIFNDGKIVFQITGEDPDSDWGYTWKVHLVNNTDKNMMFTIADAAVNNVMTDPFWADTISAGKEANEEINWMSLEDDDITDVTKVEFRLHIYDDDDISADPYVDQFYTVYPKGEDAVIDSTRQQTDTDVVLIDTDEAYMAVTGVDPDGDWGYTLKVTFINRSEHPLMFGVNDASINGVMCDPFFATSVTAGNSENADIAWSDSSFEEAGITEVQSIELPIRVTYDDDLAADPILEESYTITP